MIEKSNRTMRDIFEIKTSLVCHLLFVAYSILIPCTNGQVISGDGESERFLAGEDTPVWTAGPMQDLQPFKKLQNGELKRLLDKYDFVARVPNVTLQSKLQKFHDAAFVTGSRIIMKRNRPMKTIVSSEGSEFVYPTIVIVMDYHYKMRSELRGLEAFANYAIEFWNNVNARLSTIENPRISIRIGGIVIAIKKYSNDTSFPYGFPEMPDAQNILEMTRQWKHLLILQGGKPRIDFQKEHYDIVAHMTDYIPSDHTDSSSKTASTDTTKADHHVCDPDHGKRYIMIYEKFIFDGLDSALCALRVMVNCWSSPHKYYPPGSPLESWHLPGQHYSRVKQCEARGAVLTTQQTGCEELVCQGSESDYGQTLDGTPCSMDETRNNEKGTCWNGVCQAA